MNFASGLNNMINSACTRQRDNSGWIHESYVLVPLFCGRVHSQHRPVTISPTRQTLPRVQRGGPRPVSDLPCARTRHLGKEKQSLPGKMVPGLCVGSTTGETLTSHLDSRWSPPDSPGSTSTYGSEPAECKPSPTDSWNVGFVFIHYLSRVMFND